MVFKLTCYETLNQFARNNPDSKIEAYCLSAAMTIAGGAIAGGRIKIVKIEPSNGAYSIIAMTGKALVL